MSRRIVKVQVPVATNAEPAILIYDEARAFEVLVTDPASFADIVLAQRGALKAYWEAEIDEAALTFELLERAPDQAW